MPFWSPKPLGLNKTIGILGCGWLGLPLAKTFLKDGYCVHGTTTSNDKLTVLKKAGIAPFLISLSEDNVEGPISDFLHEVAVLIINVPPGLRGSNQENYVAKMQRLHEAIQVSSTRKVIFISSTSVYGDLEGEVTEDTPPEPKTESGKQLFASEQIFRNNKQLAISIVRFGGLIGPDRHPITMLSDKKGLSNGGDPINLIHLNDCIGIITSVVKFGWWNTTINGVYPWHPSKREYYTSEAQKRGLQIPDYKENNIKKGAIVRSNYLLNVKNYRFTTTI